MILRPSVYSPPYRRPCVETTRLRASSSRSRQYASSDCAFGWLVGRGPFCEANISLHITLITLRVKEAYTEALQELLIEGGLRGCLGHGIAEFVRMGGDQLRQLLAQPKQATTGRQYGEP